MELPTTRDSTRFPPGYGDFALQCSDRVICYFPHHLLGYMSGFFRDMFSLPEGAVEQSSKPSEPLNVTEPSEIMEPLLQHIDPRSKTPDMDPTTIVSLLEAARKYQIGVVTEWFEEEIKLKRVIVFVEDMLNAPLTQMEPLLVTNPLLVLYCAVRFDLSRPGQLALRELTQCKESLIHTTDHDLPLQVYLHGLGLRNKRIEFFKAFITELASLETHNRTARASWLASSRGRGAHTPSNTVKRVVGGRDSERKTCVACTATRASWILGMERAVREEPNWRSFVAAYERYTWKCSSCETSSWADYHRGSLQTWESVVTKTQRELPAWPF